MQSSSNTKAALRQLQNRKQIEPHKCCPASPKDNPWSAPREANRIPAALLSTATTLTPRIKQSLSFHACIHFVIRCTILAYTLSLEKLYTSVYRTLAVTN